MVPRLFEMNAVAVQNVLFDFDKTLAEFKQFIEFQSNRLQTLNNRIDKLEQELILMRVQAMGHGPTDRGGE